MALIECNSYFCTHGASQHLKGKTLACSERIETGLKRIKKNIVPHKI